MRKLCYIGAVLLFDAACTRQEPASVSKQPAAPVAVEVETATAAEVTELYRASGTVRARYTANIAAKMTGTILEVLVNAGERVAAGQTLIRLDKRDLEANLRRAEAARAEAQNVIAESENAIAAASANLELAQVTHQRFADLVAKNSVSRQEFDESAARRKAAEATLEMARAKRKQVQARVEQAEAEAAVATIALEYATLTAPFAGLVTERRADPGSLATPGAPLLVIEREGSLRLEASVDESKQALVRMGQTVEVEIEGLERAAQGRVSEITPSVDAATRTLTAKIDLPAAPSLRAGMFGRAVFPAGHRKAVLAPSSAVVERGQLQSVYVVEGNTARLRLVTLGAGRGERREVLSGLSAGEKVVVAPPAALVDGAPIAVRERGR